MKLSEIGANPLEIEKILLIAMLFNCQRMTVETILPSSNKFT